MSERSRLIEDSIVDLGNLGRFAVRVEFKGKHGEFCYQTAFAACADLPAQEGTATDEPEWDRTLKRWVIEPGGQVCIGTGVMITHFEDLGVPCPVIAGRVNSSPVLPRLIVKGRSSLSKKRIYAHMGTIDMDYIDKEIMVILENRGKKPYIINVGDRIAQMEMGICLLIPAVEINAIARCGGFGSTGE